jgi:hypothetical protein
MNITPMAMHLIIHTYTTPLPFDYPPSPCLDSTLKLLCTEGMMHTSPDRECGFELTELGVAWLKSALATPKPEKVFVDQLGHIIE